jgi:exosome complex exonuclease DIS3/RRP44
MVEEMMLLANVAVAEKILQHFPQWSLLRRHQTPSPEMYEPLLQAVATKGIIMDVTNSKTLADSLVCTINTL